MKHRKEVSLRRSAATDIIIQKHSSHYTQDKKECHHGTINYMPGGATLKFGQTQKGIDDGGTMGIDTLALGQQQHHHHNQRQPPSSSSSPATPATPGKHLWLCKSQLLKQTYTNTQTLQLAATATVAATKQSRTNEKRLSSLDSI
ncbi:unnamed protein product [Ceratitis capitata]|uniref:(Mediterranean fruit fly) hypothetical protein n=1 Tax=Ceratitis capitata TaxID=7213 RepID=A0A811TWS8_CERCA|nr:unnamed protein product [Ceratitis capitata]